MDTNRTLSFGDDEGLSAGLRAAFGPSVAGDATETHDVLATLGLEPRVLLADSGAELDREPLVRCAPPTEADSCDTIGRHEIIGEIARGGVGVVYKGRDRSLGRDVAVKTLRPDHATNRAMMQRFVDEAQIAGQLQHPGVLPVYELGLGPQGKPYFSMKLVRGQTLASLLAARPDVLADRQRFLGIFGQVCQTMAYVHAKGVIHRDLKPSNIMVGSFGELHIVDWGLAKVLSRRDESPSDAAESMIETARSQQGDWSMEGTVAGTPAYMPPEQARGETKAIDRRSDVFSLGAILLEILTGRPPYSGSRSDVLRQAREGQTADALRRLDALVVDADLADIARDCLHAAAGRRPLDAAAVANRISAFLESLDRRARESEVEAARQAAQAVGERRNRRLTLALATAILLFAFLTGGAWLWNRAQTMERTTRNTAALTESLDTAELALALARNAPPAQPAPWRKVESAVETARKLAAAPEIAPTATERMARFLGRFEQAQKARQLMEVVEDTVIAGATHMDAESWVRMGDQLADAFAGYGIDVRNASVAEIGERIRKSPMAVQLTDGLELWIATELQLGEFGALRYNLMELLEKVKALDIADPDPFRMALREQVYSTGRPDAAKLRALKAAAEFEQLLPRTLSWLGCAFGMIGDFEQSDEIYHRAILLHPDDFMLNFDYALTLATRKRWDLAIRAYSRVQALRPRNSGVWRALGLALRETGELPASIDALRQSIELQPNHGPTHADLAHSMRLAKQLDAALVSAQRAAELSPHLALVQAELGHVRRAREEWPEALAAYQAAKDAATKDKNWHEPVDDWIAECERHLR
jgi:serine/threonine protein kinase